MDYKYVKSLYGVTKDLSNNSKINIGTAVLNIGKTVYLSPDGSYCFIGADKSSTSSNNGDVFVYKYDSAVRSWDYKDNLASYASLSNHQNTTVANFGHAIISNYDGSIVYVGIPGYTTSNVTHGAVQVFSRSGESWSSSAFIENKNSDNALILANQRFGSTIALGGSNLFIGTKTSNSYANSDVLLYNSTTYAKDHNFSIKPTNSYANSNFGSSLACDASGTTLFVGSDYFGRQVGESVYYTGDVHIFTYDVSWSQLQNCYSDIKNNHSNAIATGAGIGNSVVCSADGKKLAFSTSLFVSSKYGIVFYFEYNPTTQRYDFKKRLISPNYNVLNNPFGEALSMSKDGNHMAITMRNKNVYMYQYNQYGYWKPYDKITQSIVEDISGVEYVKTSVIDSFGNSISLSYDGRFMALGAKEYRYNEPYISSGNRTGQAIIMYGKKFQTIENFENMQFGYSVPIELEATTNGTKPAIYFDPELPFVNTIYSFVNPAKIKIIGIGPKALGVKFEEDLDFIETKKIVIVGGMPAMQNIFYDGATSVIGIGQKSGLIFESRYAETNETTPLTVTMTISGDSIIYDPITSEFEGIKLGTSKVTLSQSGDLYHHPAIPVEITYDVSNAWTTSYPSGYDQTYVPTTDGLTFTDNETIESKPDKTTIQDKIGLGTSKRNALKKSIYSIPLLEKNKMNELKRSMLKRDGSVFQMEIKDISNNIDYISVSLKDPSELTTEYTKIKPSHLDAIETLDNKTDLFQIEKYKKIDTNVYDKETDEYVTVRLYHPHDNLVVYHIDDTDNVKEVNETNFPDSSIQKDTNTDYWYVRMPFSTGIGGTSSTITESVICFTKNTYIKTDQGEVKIQNINPTYHTIQHYPIVGITKTKNSLEKIICIEKNAISKNVPDKTLYISLNHMLNINNKSVYAKNIVNGRTIYMTSHTGLLYNVLMDKHIWISVHNCNVESLNPKDDNAIIHREVIWNEKYSNGEKMIFCKKFNDIAKRKYKTL